MNGVPEFKQTMLEAFLNRPNMAKMGFLSSLFKTREQDFTDSELIDIDVIERSSKVAPVVTSLKTGSVYVGNDLFTGKQVRPPLFNLSRPVDIYDLMKRQPGETEYSVGRANWTAKLQTKLQNGYNLMFDMIKLGIEKQAAQCLQSGKITLTDEDGEEAYTLDYGMKASHKIAVTNKWNESKADPLADIEAACDVIRDDGNVDATTVIFGRNAWKDFISDAKVQAALKTDGLNLGMLNPALVNKGGKYMGYINIGAYRVNLMVYNAVYEEFNSTEKTPYIDNNKVIVLADVQDLDFRLVYGGVPTLGMDPRFADIMPDEVIVENAIRYTNRIYKDEAGDAWVGNTKSRPICIPVSIDRFAALTVE